MEKIKGRKEAKEIQEKDKNKNPSYKMNTQIYST